MTCSKMKNTCSWYNFFQKRSCLICAVLKWQGVLLESETQHINLLFLKKNQGHILLKKIQRWIALYFLHCQKVTYPI